MPVRFPWNQKQGAYKVTFIAGDTSYAVHMCFGGYTHWKQIPLLWTEINMSFYVCQYVVWFQKCVLIKSCLARGYIPKAWRQVKMTFVPAPVEVNYTLAKAYCPISLLSVIQKAMQIWWQEYQAWNTAAFSHIYNNLFKPWSPQKLQCTMWLHIYRKQ
jgi:hypothetical protein